MISININHYKERDYVDKDLENPNTKVNLFRDL